ncbi:MAG: hypothetical protein RMZ43_026300 [Nostoc sp. CmiVER01]|nr:hypothetical protein [Nostoc sp. CmiVER01]MDZ8121281.1 hypothetical protein [Nostoc sp. CmiVER01]MDZ8224212.1 hypothetical protein [Nostoc sp. ChiVER01]
MRIENWPSSGENFFHSDAGAIALDVVFVVDNLEEMLERGCNWLDDYFVTRPDMRKEICPENK